MPGVTLPAGKYLFRLANPDAGRNVVQVLNADGTKPYGMFFAMRAERFEPASTPEVRFMETAAGMPTAHSSAFGAKGPWTPTSRRSHVTFFTWTSSEKISDSSRVESASPTDGS